MTRSDQPSHEGGCFCRAIRYVASEVFDAGYCHCSICRRISGAPVLAWANIKAEHFRITKGEAKVIETSAHGRHSFCQACGTPLFYGNACDDNLVGVNTATLDHPEVAPPQVHLFFGDRIPWFDTADDLARYPDNKVPHPLDRALARLSAPAKDRPGVPRDVPPHT